MPLDLDFSNVERKDPLEEGDYVFMISDAEIQPTKAKDGQNLVVTFEVVEPTEFNGRTVKNWFSLKTEALWSVRAFLEAILGEEIEGPFELNEAALPGNKVGATMVKNGEYVNPSVFFSV